LVVGVSVSWSERAGTASAFARFARRFLTQTLVLVLAVSTLSAISVVTAPSANASYTTGSADFGGSDRYLTVANGGDFAVGTGDFTVEWWQRMTSAPSSNQTMVAQSSWPRVFALDGTFQLSFEGDATNPTVYFWLGSGGATALGTLSNFSTDHQNQWKHLAVTRTSSTLRFYIGGVLINSFSNMSGNVANSTDPLYIGRQNIDIRTQFPGQITNFHFIKGTSKYGSSSTLTGLTAPFTPMDNTKLLLKFESSNSLTTDSSSANKSVINNGAVGWSNLSPTWTSNQPQTISFTNPGNKTLGSGTFSVSPTSSSGLTVTVTSATTGVCTVSGITVTLIDIGTCTLSANQSGNASFAAATQVQQSFTVSHPVCSSPTSTSSGGYTYVAFKNLGTCTWTPQAGVSKIDLLVVAGGGGGGSRHAGGGGAGGVRISTNLDVNGGPLTIVVGDGGNGGGARSDNLGNQGANGSNSSVSGGGVSTLTAIGGGGGTYDSSGGNGGSGGGGGCCGQPPGNGTDGQGNPGSAGFVTAPYYLAGGGGGAGTAGVAATGASQTTLNPVAYRAGLGGTGAEVAWIPTSVRSTLGVGVEFDSKIFFAGGGGGGTGSSGTGGTGGTGGGGAGATTTGDPAAGTSNTGGGGGGAGLQSDNTTVAGGKGGSGVVVIRYLNAPVISVASSPVTAVVGTAVTSYSISNSGGAAASYAISPALAVSGLTFSTSTGLISGTPTAAATSATYTITATNASGTSSATFSITSFPSSCSPANTLVNGFTVLQFQNVGSCSWNVPTGVTTIDILVVGGGGAGGALVGGGGGAGGYLYSTSVSVTPGAVNTITVGAGGVNSATAAGGNGGNSSFNQSLIAIGGGGGGTAAGNTDATRVGSNGGSGGGAASTSVRDGASPAVGTGTAGQGNNGGSSFTSGANVYIGGGGGGSNGVGENSNGVNGGKGGTGTLNSISGSSVCYATGGGGALYAGTGTSGAAGDCGGTANPNGGSGGLRKTAAPTAVTANTGGGGGGGAQAKDTAPTWTSGGTNGGSGVVVVRYEMTTSTILTPAFGTPTSTATGYTVQITNYSASYTWAGTATASGSVAISNTGLVTVTGVAAGTSSTATITTARDGYTGGSSNVTGASFSTAAPGAPTIGTATLGNGSATVTFTAPTPNGGSTITSYTATSNPGGFTGTLPGAGSGTITVSGLTNGTAYTFTVTATNANGTSSASAASNSVIPRTVPGAPTSFAATAGNNQVALTWAAPSSNGGSAITGYTVTSSPSVTAPASCTNTANLSCTFTGLTNGTAYTFTIRAINAAGNGTTVTVTATPGKAAQTITFNSLNDRTLGTGTYPISASSNSSLTVALTSATTDVCTVSSGTITLVSAGTCTINADQAGDDNYLAATQVQQSFTVATALTITTPSGSSLEGNHNSAYSLTISASGGAGSNSFAVTGSLPTGVTLSGGVISGTPSTAGNFSLTVTVTDANGATATTSSFTIAIAKGASTVALSIPSFTFTGSPQGPDSVTKTGSTGSVTYAYVGRDGTSYASSSTKPTNVGTYTVTATVAADDNYASVSASGNFAITAAALTAPASLAAATVTGVASAITVTFNAVTGASSYTVQLFNSGGTEVGSDYTSFTSGSRITGLTPSTAYSVKVIAVGDGTNYTSSAASSAVSVTTLAAYYLNFGGGSSQRASTTNAVIPTTGNFTIEGWISPTEYNSTRSIPVIFSQGTGSNRFYVKLNSNGSLIVFQDLGSTEITCSNAAIPLNVWTHIAVVAELVTGTRTLKCYVNSVLQTNNTNAALGGSTIGSGFYVGQYAPSAGPTATTFAGQIDEVKIWSTARTRPEIADNRNVAPLENATGLVAYYSFDATTDTTAIDLKNSANNLTLASTMSWLPLIRTVAYEAGTNGSGTTASQSGTSDRTAAITLKSAADASGITRTGYSISAWNTDAGGTSGTSYALGASYLGATDLTLYPTWTANVVAPTIGTQPTAAAKTVGQSVTFTVVATASDGGDLSYQWQKGGADISGATSASYTFVTSSTSDAGNYQVVVTNTKNTFTATSTSTAVALTMSGALSITTPTSGLSGSVGATFTTLNIASSGGSGTNSFAVASGTLPAGLSLSSGGAITGTPTTAGTQAITVRVTDSNSATTTTTSFTLSIASNVATLSALVLSSGTLSPTFASGTITYTASVANSVATGFTITPTTTQANATTVQYLGADGTTAFTGALSVGANVIRTVVTAQDGTTTSTYTVTVTRALETYTITFAAGTSGTGSNQTLTKTNGTNLTLPDSATANGYFIRTGYTVSGWSTSNGGSQTHALGGPFTTEAATTLYPVWADIAATVYFLADDYTAGSTTWTERIANAAGTTASGGMTKGTSPTSVVFAGKESSNSDRLTGSIGSTSGLSAVTVEMWVRLSDNGSTQNASGSMLFSWSSNTGTGNYNIYHNSSKLGFNTFNSELYGINSATHEQKWRHYVFVMSTGAVDTQKIYVNGVLQTLSYQFNTAMGTRAFNASGNFVVMDNPIGANTWNAKGNLGSLRVYRGELNDSQAASLYDATKSNYEFLTVTYDSQGGSPVDAASTAAGGSIATAPTPPTRTGFTFAGWSTTSSGSAISFTGGYTHGQSADFTLFALWTAGSLVVTFDTKGGTSVSNGSTSSGASISAAPTAPTRTGYTLSGWSATDGGTVVTFPYAHGYTANFTMYAIWSANTLTITYDEQSGSSIADGTVLVGASISAAPTAPTRAGYTLSGWSTTSSGSVVSFPYEHLQTDNFTLYAIWAAISCSPTSTTAGGYTVYTFTTAGTCFWTVPNGVTDVELLAVAGGGGGGYSYDNAGAGGGAGGQVKTGTATLSTTLEVTVGAGGAGGIVTSTRGGTGSSSVVSTITALGGTGGCGARATTCSNSAQATSLAAANGGVGGAGGASGKGGGGSNTSGSVTSTITGGAGTASSFTGSSVTYGVGGAGGAARGSGTNIPGSAGSANTGNGGGGASAKSSSGQVNGGAGATGLVVVRVASALTVTYDSQSGSDVTAGSTVTGGSISTAPTDPTRANYTFLGWFAASTGGSALTFPYTHGRTADFTLYAQWSLNTYSITFDKNSGDAAGSMGNQTFTHGVAFNLNANLYSRPNYVFYRWATAADGTGTTPSNLAQVTLTAATTLYAQWTANTYVVTYSYNGGDGGDSTASSSFTTGGTAITLPVPTKTGFTFAGWHSDSALTTAIGSNSGSGTYSPTGATLSLNAYAKWTAVNYTFTYNANSGSGSVPTETSKQITQTVTVKANTGSLERAGYTFSGWNTASNGTGDNYLSGSLFTVEAANVVLYAKWTANTYTITYNANGGSGSAQRSSANVASDNFTTGGSPVVLPDAGTLTRTGYTFGGWNTSAAGTGTDYAATNTYTTVSNVIFYAKWNPITYTITYNGNSSDGGTHQRQVATQQVKHLHIQF
jgi:uncharacterized repeat protein (TIGR02543 family)